MPCYHEHDFHNKGDKTETILVEHGGIVRIRDENGRRNEYGDYTGEENGTEVEVPPGFSATTILFPENA